MKFFKSSAMQQPENKFFNKMNGLIEHGKWPCTGIYLLDDNQSGFLIITSNLNPVFVARMSGSKTKSNIFGR